MSKKINPSDADGARDRLTPFEVAVLSRAMRASIIPEADHVSSWGTPVIITAETERTWLVESSRGDEIWVAESVRELNSDSIRPVLPWNGVITLPESWAIEKEPA